MAELSCRQSSDHVGPVYPICGPSLRRPASMHGESESRTVVLRAAVCPSVHPMCHGDWCSFGPFDLCVLERHTYTRRFRVSSPVAVFTTSRGTFPRRLDIKAPSPRDRRSPVARVQMTTRTWRCATPRNMSCRNIGYRQSNTGIPRC